MPRLGTELLVSVIGSLVMTGMVLIWVVMSASPWPAPTGRGVDGERCLDEPIRALAMSTIEGQARLCVDPGGVRPALRLSGLRAGEAYTAWLAYFEEPWACLVTPCHTIDLLGDDPVGVLGRVDGAVAPATGELHLQADVRDLHATSKAQLTVLVFGHGEANEQSGRARARQLLSLQTPDMGAPLAGAVADGDRAWPLAQAVFRLP